MIEREMIYEGHAPELMNTKELAASLDRLRERLEVLKDTALEDNGQAAAIAEDVSMQSARWYTKAVFLSLKDRYSKLDASSRDIILSYLFDMMFNGRRSVRKAAAQAAGELIAAFCQEDINVWSDFLHKALFIKKGESERARGLSEDPLRTVFLCVYNSVREDSKKAVLASYASYFKSTRWDTWTCMRLISGIFTIPVGQWGAMQKGNIGGFIRYFLRREDGEVRASCEFLLSIWIDQGWKPSEDFEGFLLASFVSILDGSFGNVSPAENELIRNICRSLGLEDKVSCLPAADDSILFRENLTSGHSWLYKLVNLRLLKSRYSGASYKDPGFGTYVIHLLTLLRLNPNEIVFAQAGEDILAASGHITDQHKHQIAKELLKTLENGQDETGYIPRFIGRLFGGLSNNVRQDLLDDIQALCGSRNEETCGNSIEMVCCIVSGMAAKNLKDSESIRIMHKLCGILDQSLYNDQTDVVSHAMFSIGCDLFKDLKAEMTAGSVSVDECFEDLARNALICMAGSGNTDPLCHAVPARCIASWEAEYARRAPEASRPVAFYAGSFDPFSNGHRAIVREIAEMGFQVYVNVHDFAWDKNVQPLLIRRRMAAMSVTDLPHVQLFPEGITVNMDNPKDLDKLRSLFPGREVWMVAGIDHMISEAAAEFPHIVFARSETYGYSDEEEIISRIRGEVITLRIPVYYEHMTSWEIRNNIKDGKSIEGLVAPQILDFIRRNNLYADVRVEKPDLMQLAIETEVSDDACSIYKIEGDERLLCASICFNEENDESEGRSVYLKSIDVVTEPVSMYTEIIMDETMTALQSRGYAYCCACGHVFDPDLLIRSGFIKISESSDMWTVCMKDPAVIFSDVLSCITDTFAEDEQMIEVCVDNAKRLERAAAQLYPGSLLLNIDTGVMNYRLSGKIIHACLEEGFERICSPFGKILKSVGIPGVITMPLNSEKRYDTDLAGFEIVEKKGYPELAAQMRTIRSMDMPFVLVDDLFHKGYRMKKVSLSLSQEGMHEDGVIVGVISSQGKELRDRESRNIDAVYEVPNLRYWIIESDMIPFFGGDKVESMPGVYTSTYPMLPYQFPSFLKDASYDSVYNFSYVCLENAVRFFAVLEALYKEKYHRTLSAGRLSEVLTEAGCPESFYGAEYENRPASQLISEELKRLKRLRKGGRS